MKLSFIAILCALCSVSLGIASFSGVAIADEVTKASSEKQADTAVTFRKSLLQLIRSNMGPLGAMAKGNIPMDADVIAINAQRIEFLGEMMHEYFALDTTAYPVDTGAKDLVWKEHLDFTSKANDLVAAAADLQRLVANGESGDFRKGIGALGSTCKACHDKFKKD
jgi:cytochrome c556